MLDAATLTLLEDRLIMLLFALVGHVFLLSYLIWDQIPRGLMPLHWLDGPLLRLTQRLNRSDRSSAKRRFRGGMLTLYLLGWVVATGFALQAIMHGFHGLPYGWLAESVVIALALGWRPAIDLARSIADEGHDRSLEEVRRRLDGFCPFDHGRLDISGVYRLTIELLAHRTFFICGVSSWYLLLGMPGAALFAGIDRIARLLAQPAPKLWAFGSLCRFLYGIVALPPALWAGVVMTVGAMIAAGNHPLALFRRQAQQAAIAPYQQSLLLAARALNVQLGGKRMILGMPVDQPWIGDGEPKAADHHLRAMLQLVLVSGLCFILTVLALYYAVQQ